MINFRSKEMRMLAIGFACATALAMSGCGGSGGDGSNDKKATLPNSAAAVSMADYLYWTGDNLDLVSGASDQITGNLESGEYPDGCGRGGKYTLTVGTPGTVVFSNFALYCPSADDYPAVNGTMNYSYLDPNATGGSTNSLTLHDLAIRFDADSSDTLNGTFAVTRNLDDSHEYTTTVTLLQSNGYSFNFEGFGVKLNDQNQVVHVEGTYKGPEGSLAFATPTDFTYVGCSWVTPSSGVMTLTDSAGEWTIDFGAGTDCDHVLVTRPDGSATTEVWES